MEIRLEALKGMGVESPVVLIDLPEPCSHKEILKKAKEYVKANLDISVPWFVYKGMDYVGDVSKNTVYSIDSGKVRKYATRIPPNGKTTFSSKYEAEEALRHIKVEAEERLDYIEDALDKFQKELEFSMEAVSTDSSGIGLEIEVEVKGCRFTRVVY